MAPAGAEHLAHERKLTLSQDKVVAQPPVPVYHVGMNDIDRNGKYWTIQRDASFYAVWRGSPPMLHPHPQVEYLWRICECYATDPALHPSAPDNVAESYVWATTRSLSNADTIANAFAAKYGGTIWADPTIAVGSDDPDRDRYDPDRWS